MFFEQVSDVTLSEKNAIISVCNCKSEISNVCNTVEGHCLQAMKIVHHHANGCFGWLITEHYKALILGENQFLHCLGNTKDLRLSILWNSTELAVTSISCFISILYFS